MSGFRHRALSEEEQWVAAYEDLVAALPGGYEMSLDEYTNDISCRQRLEERRARPEVRSLWPRVEAADARLREALSPTSRCIHGVHPPACFWYWGYPPNSPRLEADLASLGIL